jgi:hypothetical protein
VDLGDGNTVVLEVERICHKQYFSLLFRTFSPCVKVKRNSNGSALRDLPPSEEA